MWAAGRGSVGYGGIRGVAKVWQGIGGVLR